MRDDEERTEARRDHAFLTALRIAIPASISDKADVQGHYEKLEAKLRAKANGDAAAAKEKRWAPSKKRRPIPR